MRYSTAIFKETDQFRVIHYSSDDSWLTGRKSGIGGSDAACVVGLNPWKTNVELFMEKTGQTEAPDISDKPAVIYGKKAEEPIRRLYQLDHPEMTVYYQNNTTLESKEYPFMRYSPDGLLKDEQGRLGILEIKTTTILQSMQKEKWKDKVPDNYFCQILHGLLVTGFEFVELRTVLRYNNEYSAIKTYHFERSDCLDDIEYLKQAEIEFWEEHIMKNVQPYQILPELYLPE